ncbi:MAG: EAL domain-containing protein [Clostridia bacterium]|nr:EAL domain-containing protein [Clostridia bacterium]
MIDSLLSIARDSQSRGFVLEYLNNSTYDDMLGIDLKEDRFKFLYNIEGKYQIPATEGSFRNFYSYAVDHLVHEEDRQVYAGAMEPDTLAGRLDRAELPGVLDFQYRVPNLEGGWRWVEQVVVGGAANGLPEGLVYCYIYDVQNIKDREAGVTRVRSHGRAVHDPLTGLLRDDDFFSATKPLLNNRSMNWMLIVIDLEQFKLFNEWYGRKAGDMVLARIGSGLTKDAEACDGIAGYMGNDDFCLLVPAGRIDIQQLYENVHRVIVRFGVSIGFLPSFGISCSNGSTSILNLFDQASLACRHAKQDFKNRIRTFEPSMYNKTAEDYRILSDFQDALKNGEITFWLQPQVRASTGRVVGAESLARWIKPNGQMVPPSAFVPVLEKYGFIPDLDKFIWESVCRWSRSCLERGLPLIPVSVNVSQVDIFTLNVTDHFCALLERYGLPRSTVKIEITESACGEDSQKVRDTVQQLREQGFVVLMDDFGSGYSSLNMLHELNIDIIKLDAYFLHLDNTSDKKGMRILESIVNMAKTLTLPIIVEGVETESQKDYLMSLGCRYMQGFFFHKPMPVADFEALIARPGQVDDRGFIFKANDQFRIREFMNDAIYSDAMLNNIIGPAAVYAWHDGAVDIVRFNQQFFEAVNVPDFDQRLEGIQQFMPEKDRRQLFELLAQADRDRLNGAAGVMTFGRVDGDFSRFLIHFYFLNETDGSKRFYGAARDVTEMATLGRHMELLARHSSSSVIFLIRQHGKYSYEVAAHGLADSMKLSKDQLQAELNDGSFYKRVSEESRASLLRQENTLGSARQGFSQQLSMQAGDGGWVQLSLRADPVDEADSDVRWIFSIRRADQ